MRYYNIRKQYLALFAFLVFLSSAFNCKNNDPENSAFAEIGSGGWGKSRELSYQTGDGWTIRATFFPSYKRQKPLFISIHMLMSDRSYYPVQSKMLRDYNVLKIDMRGHGDSMQYKGRRAHWRSGKGNMFWGSFKDIRKGISEIDRLYGNSVDTKRIFLQGSSYSCVLILLYYIKHPQNISGLIFMSPGNSYKQSIVNVYYRMLSRKAKVPVIHVCSSKDFYCKTKTSSMKRSFNIKCRKSGKAVLSDAACSKTKFIIEDEHVHGTHFFYTHPNKYPGVIVNWMNSVIKN